MIAAAIHHELQPAPAPKGLVEIDPFAVPIDALHIPADDTNSLYIRYAREAATTLADELAATHRAVVNSENVRLGVSELTTNGSRQGRHPTGVTIEWHEDIIAETPIPVEPGKVSPEAVGHLVIRVGDDLPYFVDDPRPDHPYGLPEAQETPLFAGEETEADEELSPKMVAGEEAAKALALQEQLALESWADLIEETATEGATEENEHALSPVDSKPKPKDEQSGRGIDVLLELATAMCYYIQQESVDETTIGACRAIGKMVIMVVPAFPQPTRTNCLDASMDSRH